MTDLEKLSALVAVGIMGWQKHPVAGWGWEVNSPHLIRVDRLQWWPASYLNDSMEALETRCSQFSSHREWHMFNREPQRSHMVLMNGSGKFWRAEAPTLPLAITICLLRSIDIDEAVLASALGDCEYV